MVLSVFDISAVILALIMTNTLLVIAFRRIHVLETRVLDYRRAIASLKR